MNRGFLVILLGLLGGFGGTARAQDTPARVAVTGYVETFYQWNFNRPSNGLTNFRGFDNRHNAFTIANAVLDVTGQRGPVSARLAFQVGHTPETYYSAEPRSVGAAGAGTTDQDVWKFLQQANVGYLLPAGGVRVEGGLFPSPIGPEGFAIKDQWNWSRSNLFFGLPFYHTGIAVSAPVGERWAARLMVVNGWNSVVDDNAEKSVAAVLSYESPESLKAQALYFGGVERPGGAVEGRPWRHLFDAFAVWQPTAWGALSAQANGGFERNRFGTSSWLAGALYARLRARPWLYVAARGDAFDEHVPANASGRATPIFWPSSWVASGTLTLDVRPAPNASVRLEYRHDEAAGPTYFRGNVPVDATGAFVANAQRQDTLTLGMVAWF